MKYLTCFALFLALMPAPAARAQLSTPITGATAAPHCTVAQLAARTGPCSVITPDSDEIAVVTDATGDTCVVGGGAVQVPCAYNATLAAWIPMWGLTNPATSNLSMAGLDILNVDLFDFNVDPCATLTNPKLYTNASGNVLCIEEVGGGTGHVIQEEGASLTQRGSLDFVGTGVTCTDTGAKTQCLVPGMTVPIANGTNFVGSVSCPGGVPATGTAANCTAVVTSLNGTVLADGFLELAGTYNATTPHTLTDGFKITSATFLPTCNNTAFECGDNFVTFTGQLQTLGAQYDPYTTGVGAAKHIKFVSYGYQIDPRRPFKLTGTGWTLDFSDGPAHFDLIGNADNTATVIAQTATITVGTSATTLTCASCGFCATGTCSDGDELLRPGDAVLLGNTAAWDTGRVNIVGSITNDDVLSLVVPELTDYSGQITIATGKAWEFDNIDAALGVLGDVEIIGGANANIACTGVCQYINPWSTPAFTYSGSPPNGGHRKVPLQGIVNRLNETNITMGVSSFYGRNDASVTFAGNNSVTSTFNHGEFTGIVQPIASSYQLKQAQTNANDTTSADDGYGSAFRIIAPNVRINPRGMSGGNIYALVYGDACGNLDIDGRMAEGYSQVLFAPTGCQNLRLHDVSREQSQGCDTDPTCPSIAARKPFIEIGPWAWDSTEIGSQYDLDIGKVFFLDSYKAPFLKITDPQPTRVNLNASVEYTNDLLQVSSNAIEISGRVRCLQSSGDATACDLPALGTYPDLLITDKDGAVLRDTRDLRKMTKNALNLSQITDDATSSKCLLSGGGGGDPGWATCPGGGSTIVVAEADGTPSLTLDTLQFDNADGFVLTDLGSGDGRIDQVLNMEYDSGNGKVYPRTASSTGLLIGSNVIATADHIFQVDGSVVLNEQSVASNVRIETDTVDNAFCTNGTTNRVGIGFSGSCPPVSTLDVSGRTTSIDATITGSVTMPNGAAPTTDAVGELALDTTITDHQSLFQYYDGAKNMTLIAIDTAELPALDNEIVKYDAATDKWQLEADAGSGSGAFDDLSDVVLTSPATGATIVKSATDWIDGSLDLADADAVGTSILDVGNGGSGRATGTTAYALVATGTTAAGVQQSLASGATTEVLVGGGASALPVWTTATGTGAPVRAGSPTLAGTVTVGTQLAITSGCTMDTDIDCPANSTAGGALTLKEDTDLGTDSWKLDLAAVNLSAPFTISPQTSGLLLATGLLHVATTDRLLGRDTAGAGAAEEITGAAALTMIGAVPLAGGTMTGELGVDDLGLEFAEGDTMTTCANFSATGGGIFYDDSENKFKKCMNNVLTDMDTSAGSPDFGTITSGTNTGAAMTVSTGASIIFNTAISGTGGMTGTDTIAGDAQLANNTVTIGSTGIIFEGATGGGANAFESLLTLTDPTADRTWTLPDASGSVTIGPAAGPITFTGPSTARSIALPDAASVVLARTDAGNSFTGTQTLGSATSLLLGTAGSAVGDIGFRNATSGTITVAPVTGALGTVTLSLPAATDTLVGKQTTDVLTNKTLDAEGTGNVLTTKEIIWFPAAGCNNATSSPFFDLPTATPAVAACVTGTNTQKGVLDYADTSGGFSAQITHALPVDWTTTSGVDITLYWTTTATSGNAKWSVSTSCTNTDATEADDLAFNTANTVTTAAPGTSPRVQTSTITGMTMTGCTTASRELLHLKVFRDGNDGSDTITATARLIGMEMTYRRAQ